MDTYLLTILMKEILNIDGKTLLSFSLMNKKIRGVYDKYMRKQHIRKYLTDKKEESYKYFNRKDALIAVNLDSRALRYVKDQTEEICLAAVNDNRAALQYVI